MLLRKNKEGLKLHRTDETFRICLEPNEVILCGLVGRIEGLCKERILWQRRSRAGCSTVSAWSYLSF